MPFDASAFPTPRTPAQEAADALSIALADAIAAAWSIGRPIPADLAQFIAQAELEPFA